MILTALLSASLFLAQEPSGFEALAATVHERQLANGLRVLVMPHGDAPVASFHVHVNTGSIDEAAGLTGLAHFAEHMAFKGSRRVGATDWLAERRALDACDDAWKGYERAIAAGVDADQVETLRVAFERARDAADALCDPGAFDRFMETSGGRNSNASTGADSTSYFVSLPVERMETWFWLTREMLGDPVMREFYKERDVVMEERRMRFCVRESTTAVLADAAKAASSPSGLLRSTLASGSSTPAKTARSVSGDPPSRTD